MLYRNDKYGNQISQLGYGCMRFTRKGSSIDFDKAEKEIMNAYAQGVNYYDTAYVYPGSEECLGKILKKNGIREKVSIATKLPQYIMRSQEGMEKTFLEELKRLQTDYIDYYLMHMFTDIKEWDHIKSLGVEEWIAKHKEDGSIRQIGFSFHGDTDMFVKILNAYDWDFCQIQYNYLDEHSQAGRKGLEAAAEKGLPVIIMEPLRGGKLVNLLPDSAKKIMKENENGFTAAEWGLRWLWNQKEVTCILSGMNSMEMVDENIRIASVAEPEHFTEKEFQAIDQIRAAIRENEMVGCTACRYCMPCPKGVDIPGTFFYYNLSAIEGKTSARFGYAQTMGMRKEPPFASLCVGCGKCEKHCPQHINIREELKKADKVLRPLPIKAGLALARKIMIKG